MLKSTKKKFCHRSFCAPLYMDQYVDYRKELQLEPSYYNYLENKKLNFVLLSFFKGITGTQRQE